MKKQINRMVLSFAFFIVTSGMSVTPSIAQDDPADFKISHHHIGISVPNAEESAAWYRKMLGFEIVTRMNQGAGMTVVHIKRGNCYIELFQVDGAKSLPDYRRDPTKDLGVHGTVHFAFQVSDALAVIKELRTKGAEIAMEPVVTPGVVFAFIRDNSGNCFEIIQYKNQ